MEAFLNNSEGVEVQRGLDGKLLYLPRNTSLMHSKYRHIHDASEICQINLANRYAILTCCNMVLVSELLSGR